MKAFIAALVCVVIIAVGGAFVLSTQQRSVDVAFSTESTRLDAPGHVLIKAN